MFGCWYGCSVVVGKCLAMGMVVCGCFEVVEVEWCLFVEIFYIFLICHILKNKMRLLIDKMIFKLLKPKFFKTIAMKAHRALE